MAALDLPEYYEFIAEEKNVQSLDPLGLDDFLIEKLPRLNGDKNTVAIVEFSRRLELAPDRIQCFDPLAARAAIRDLSMVASSLCRGGIGMEEVPEVEKALIILSNISREVPADTVFSYATRNPEGRRTRTFTTHSQERVFIKGVRRGTENIPLAVRALDIAQGLSVREPRFSAMLLIASEKFAPMVHEMARIRKIVTPTFFTEELRPFFEPKVIGGKTYQAPGGAQTPLILIDNMLWGDQGSGSRYAKYFGENLEYLPLIMRERTATMRSRPPLVFQAMRGMPKPDEDPRECDMVRESLLALRKMLEMLERFRIPHLKTAQENMKIRPQGSLGSGGYNTDILVYLLEKTTSAKAIIEGLLRLL